MDRLVSQAHVAVGVGIVLLGLAALLLPKGSRSHRLAGKLFVVAMMALVGSGLVLEVLRPDVPGANVLGLLTLYLGLTGWRTARDREGKTGRFEFAAGAAAVGIALLSFLVGWIGTTHPNGPKDESFAPVAMVIGVVALIFAAQDLMVARRGVLTGPRRIARHVSRMGFAAFFTILAGLIGQLNRFPEAVRPYLPYVVLLSLLLTLYWLIRVRFTRWRMRAA